MCEVLTIPPCRQDLAGRMMCEAERLQAGRVMCEVMPIPCRRQGAGRRMCEVLTVPPPSTVDTTLFTVTFL